jgi:hypothetical protein
MYWGPLCTLRPTRTTKTPGLIGYLSRGELVYTGYLGLTRGDGGQNLIGPEIT